jgi:hypothetical protein
MPFLGEPFFVLLLSNSYLLLLVWNITFFAFSYSPSFIKLLLILYSQALQPASGTLHQSLLQREKLIIGSHYVPA